MKINDINNIKFILLVILIFFAIILYYKKNTLIKGSYEPQQYTNFNNIKMLYLKNYTKNNIPEKFKSFYKKLSNLYPIIKNKKIFFSELNKKEIDKIMKNIEYPIYSNIKENEILNSHNNQDFNVDYKYFWGILTSNKCVPKKWGNNINWKGLNINKTKYYEYIINLWTTESSTEKSFYTIINE